MPRIGFDDVKDQRLHIQRRFGRIARIKLDRTLNSTATVPAKYSLILKLAQNHQNV